MSRVRGFTLLELMIAVAVVGILAAIAYPSYMEHIRKSRRAEAQGVLMDIAMRQQQSLLDARRYVDLDTEAKVQALVNVPTTVQNFYTFQSPAPATTSIPTFSATAIPKGDQVNDKCGTLGVDQTGTKTASKDGVSVSDCW